MRVETKTVTYYTLAELKEHHPNAYEKALDAVRTSMWNDMAWTQDVAETIGYEFGRRVGDPTVERYGEGDYPGIDGVKLHGWAVQARDAHVAFGGTLYPDDTTALPWHEWLDHVTLRAGRSYTEVTVVDSDEAPYVPWNKPEKDLTSSDQRALVQARDAMRDAVQEALSEALAAGEKQAEYLESEEHLLELAGDQEWEFDENGAWA